MNIIIVGAGALGREIFSWLTHEIKTKKDLQIKGFLDDNPNALDGYNYPAEIVGSIADYKPQENELFVLAVMGPSVKRAIVEQLKKRGAKFYTLVHPSVIQGLNVVLGDGCVISPYCILTSDICIGDFVFINMNTTIGHDVKVGAYTSINGKSEISGCAVVGDGCLLGVGAKIIPNVKINDSAVVGVGSVVMRDVAAKVTVFGNPAKECWLEIDMEQGIDMEQEIRNLFASILQAPAEMINQLSSPDNVEQWDSLNHLNLIAAFEERFSIDIEPEEIIVMRESFDKFKNIVLQKIK